MSNTRETQDGSEPALGAGIAATLPAVNQLANTLAANEADQIVANPATFPVGQWDRYTFVRMLGQGGMGAVYEARDNRLNRHVALKFIRGGDPSLTMRLAREARAQARIEHENVCKVFEVGEVEGKAYIAMQFVQGDTLDKAAARMSLDEKVIVIRDVAMALHAAHTLGILHRDIKPSNILVEVGDDGRRKPIVMDFGLARDEVESHGMTETGAILGTPAYMSPEQARGGRDVDRRSDVYSLGATLYELVSGDAPFMGDTPMNIVLSVLNDEPIPLRTRVPSVPVDLATITAKCLHKDPGQRYESARALAEDLDRHIRGEPILGRRESRYRRIRRWAAKRRALVVTAFLAFVAVAVAVGITLNGRLQAAREKAELQAQAETERELGQDIKEMEWLLRTAHMLPLHDVTRERAMVKERMKRIEERGSSGGRIGALVDYAMGRGHLALGEDEEAYNRLTRAQKGGIDSPELHYALGLVLGRRYDRALLEARKEKGSGHDKKEIEKEYLVPILVAMEKSRSARLESPSYMDALLAYYKKNYDEALQLAQKALTETPWLYEAIELQAGVHVTRGIEQTLQGEFDLANKDFTEASRLFDAAAEIGRSDARLYEGSAKALQQALSVATDAKAAKALFHDVLARSRAAIAIDPSRPGPYFVIAGAYRNMRNRALERNDPRPTFDGEIEALEKAIEIGGKTRIACSDISDTYRQRAKYLMVRGLDADTSIHAAVERGLCAAEAKMDDVTLAFVGRAEKNEESRDLVFEGQVLSFPLMARWEVSRGKDPAPSLQPAFDIVSNYLRSNPRNAIALRYQGTFHLGIARFQFDAGQDARNALGLAEQNLEESKRITPTIRTATSLAELFLLRAEDALDRAENPQLALQSAAENAAACLAMFDLNGECNLAMVRHALLEARAEAASGRDEHEWLDEAMKKANALVVARLSEAGGSEYEYAVEAYQVVADVTRRLVAIARPNERGKQIAAGIAACEKGLALNPNHPRLLLTCGGIRLSEAAGLAGQTRKDAAKKAMELLEKAATLNPLLRRDVDPLVAEAKRLNAGP